jgi:cobyrinic acid a,c-diamide synthase
VIMIAAPHSGSGKTSIAAAMAHHWTSKGLVVRVFKVGPDYIDPIVLAEASNNEVYQIDLWMTGEDHARGLIERAAANADVVIVESMMGLYDGTPSSADLASMLNLPIVLVIDVSAMAETFGAIVHGLSSYRKDINVCGVIANKVASPGHLELLRESLLDSVPLLASLAYDKKIAFPERHLGLYQAAEIENLSKKLDDIAQALELRFVLSQLPSYQISSKSTSVDRTKEGAFYKQKPLAGHKVGVSRDHAFQFVYPANIDCLVELGAEIIYVSPLNDAELPADIDALYLVGGYPELDARQLSENRSFLDSVHRFAEGNNPVVAECGGFMYLQKSLKTIDNMVHPMAGVFAGQALMSDKLCAIGMQYVDAGHKQIKGHAFHYSRIEGIDLEPFAHSYYHNNDDRKAEPIYRHLNSIGSYMHFYFPSHPELVVDWFIKGKSNKCSKSYFVQCR